MQQIGFLLQNLLSAQHVSGTIVSIIRSSIILQMVAACGTWVFGLPVVGLAWSCRFYASGLRDIARAITCSSTPEQRSVNQRPKYHKQQPSVEFLSSWWWWAQWCPKHVERTISFAIKIQSVASSRPFIFHVLVHFIGLVSLVINNPRNEH
jgi:hypothetical protein